MQSPEQYDKPDGQQSQASTPDGNTEAPLRLYKVNIER